MKKLLAVLIILLAWRMAEAQEIQLPPAAAASDSTAGHANKTSTQTARKPIFHVTAGLDFSTAFSYGSAFTQYVAPQVSYPLGKKFMVSGGLFIANTNYFNAKPWYTSENASGTSGNFTSVTVFGSGTYFVNDRLTLSGAFYKQFPVSGQQISYSPYSPLNNTQGAQGFNVNVQYRIGNNMFIRAGVRLDQGVNPWYTNPFAPSPFGTGCRSQDAGCGYWGW
jgi:hypothetical protein